MFPGGKKDGAEEYEGGRTASDIVAFALDKLSENVPAPELLQVQVFLKKCLICYAICKPV